MQHCFLRPEDVLQSTKLSHRPKAEIFRKCSRHSLHASGRRYVIVLITAEVNIFS